MPELKIDKRSTLTPLLATLAALTLSACSGDRAGESTATTAEPPATTLEDVERDAAELGETLADFGADQKTAARQEIDAAIDRLDRRYAAIEARVESDWEQLNASTRAEARSTLDTLAEKKAEFSRAYADVAGDTDDAWEDVKDGFTEAYAEIDDAFRDAEREFGSGT